MRNGKELFLSSGGKNQQNKKISKHEFDSSLLMSNLYLECITNNNKQKFSLLFQGTTKETLFLQIQRQENDLCKQIPHKYNSFYHLCTSTYCSALVSHLYYELIHKDCYLPIDAIFPSV